MSIATSLLRLANASVDLQHLMILAAHCLHRATACLSPGLPHPSRHAWLRALQVTKQQHLPACSTCLALKAVLLALKQV